jgi:hypothetical protein
MTHEEAKHRLAQLVPNGQRGLQTDDEWWPGEMEHRTRITASAGPTLATGQTYEEALDGLTAMLQTRNRPNK